MIPSGIDYRRTYHILEAALAGIERSAEADAALSGILEAILLGPEPPGKTLGITSARLYARDKDESVLRLVAAVGGETQVDPGFTVPLSYAPIRRLLEDGFVLMERDDPEFDPSIEGRVGMTRFAAIAVGRESTHVIAFSMGPELDSSHAVYLLGTMRHVINLKLLQGHMLSDLEEARRIQTSLLPVEAPKFHDFDLAARSVAAEKVGGDLYDYIVLSDKNLGVAIADSCGHGLPAALMARDVMTGLRVVLDINFRLTLAVERVNKVVSRSALASRFISLFYGEFEPSGNLVYCNAGHPPPLLRRGDEVSELRRGGIVLGPNPNASYERGFRNFPPGSTLLLYTDGVTEALSPGGKSFGPESLARLLVEMKSAASQEIIDELFARLAAHSPGRLEDDCTAVVVRRPD